MKKVYLTPYIYLALVAAGMILMLAVDKKIKAYATIPITPPTPPISSTPTPTITPNIKPVISTDYLISGKQYRYYKSVVFGYDLNLNDVFNNKSYKSTAWFENK